MIRDKRTTDLASYEHDGYTWGKVIARWDVGPYTLLEYHPWKVNGVRVLTGDVDYSKIAYGCYVDGKSTSRSTSTIEGALANCMAYKHDGANSQAAEFFVRMIGVVEK